MYPSILDFFGRFEYTVSFYSFFGELFDRCVCCTILFSLRGWVRLGHCICTMRIWEGGVRLVGWSTDALLELYSRPCIPILVDIYLLQRVTVCVLVLASDSNSEPPSLS